MDLAITKRLVLSYYTGHLRDPELRKAIEHAREWDPVVRSWFSQMESFGKPDGIEVEPVTVPSQSVAANPYRFRVDPAPENSLGADTSSLRPDFGVPPELPMRRVNPVTKQVELWETPQTIPYGVARVVVEFAGREVFRRLVPFIQEFEGGVEARKAGLWLSELGVPVADIPKAYFDVIPATDANLREFPLPEVEEWAKAYSANFAAADAADMLIHRLKREGHS